MNLFLHFNAPLPTVPEANRRFKIMLEIELFAGMSPQAVCAGIVFYDSGVSGENFAPAGDKEDSFQPPIYTSARQPVCEQILPSE
jgi:hypothetical protein